MVARDELQSHLAQLLAVERCRDYGPNGLQVEGRPQVHRLITGVTARLALIEAAARDQADAILVHHGLFWRGHDGRVTGWMRERLARPLRRYSLPLGGNARSAKGAA